MGALVWAESHASAEENLARRQLGTRGEPAAATAAGIETFMIDAGIDDHRLCSPADVAVLAGGTAYEVIRLEAVVEDLLHSGTAVEDFAEAVEQ